MITWYEHHGAKVAVQEHLRGRHWEYCLCSRCARFVPGGTQRCSIADDLYQFDVKHNLVTPVWECSEFQPCDDS